MLLKKILKFVTLGGISLRFVTLLEGSCIYPSKSIFRYQKFQSMTEIICHLYVNLTPCKPQNGHMLYIAITLVTLGFLPQNFHIRVN